MQKIKAKIIPFLLYALPILFFVIAYFLIIVSGEDIYQGASSTPDILNDMLAAFDHSARLSDMYAWSVINFFDYCYSFGVDTIFRLLDVAMVFGIFYLMTDFVLARRPRLELKDALIFDLCFLTVILTPNGRILYSGFSAIHNYLPIALSSLVFLTPYVRWLQKRPVPNKLWFKFLMIFIGFIFGTTSNITPIAAALAFVVIFGIYWLKNKKIPWHQLLNSWGFWGFLGLIFGISLFSILGSGINNYAGSNYADIYDYLSFEQIFANPWQSLGTILYHTVYNFGRFLIPIFAILAVILAVKYFTTKNLKFKFSNPQKNLFLALGIFIFLHLLAMTQIKYPTRLALPAYLIAIVLTLTIFNEWLKSQKETILIRIFAILGICATSAIVGIKIYFAISYQKQMSWFIEDIKNPEITTICINAGDTTPKDLPYIHLGQEDTMGEWWVPAITNNTTIDYCQE